MYVSLSMFSTRTIGNLCLILKCVILGFGLFGMLRIKQYKKYKNIVHVTYFDYG